MVDRNITTNKGGPTTLPFICFTLENYGSLEQIYRSSFLPNLADSFLRPLIQATQFNSQSATLVLDAFPTVGKVVEVATATVRAQKSSTTTDIGDDMTLCSDLQKVLDLLADTFQYEERDPRVPVSNRWRESLGNQVLEKMAQIIIKNRIEPISPTTRFLLQKWVNRIIQFVQFEEHASKNFSEPVSLIKMFFENEAGFHWARRMRTDLLEKTRTIIKGDWNGWEGVEVKKERLSGEVGVERFEDPSADKYDKPSASVPGARAYDDLSISEKQGTQKSTAAPVDNDPSDIRDDTASGSNSGSRDETSPVQTAVPLKKPIRQARKLGKKHKGNQARSDETRPSTPTLRSAENDFIDQEQARGSDEADPLAGRPTVEPEASQAEGPQVISERFTVSRACDAILELVFAVFENVQGLQAMDPPADSFRKLPETIGFIAPEILGLYGQLMPEAHASQIENVPALAMQFSNDCAHIAHVVESMALDTNWMPSEPMERLRGLGEAAYQKQIVSFSPKSAHDGLR